MTLTCAQARATVAPLLPTHLQDLNPTLRLLLEGLGEVEGETVEGETTPEVAAAQHIGTCAACQAWLDLEGRYPTRAARRERLARYCCGDMFEAVTNTEYPVRFSLALGRDFEPYWLINDLSVAKFCPWCGARLPAQSFEKASGDG